MNVIFSIIIPCYNQINYLEDCLNSVLNQNFIEWECIIVDDGSTDGSKNIAHKFCTFDSRFKYFYKTNGGLASTRNFGIHQSTGTYILPLDGDDKIGENYLIKAFENFKLKPETKLVYCLGKLFGDSNKLYKLPDYTYETLLFKNCIFCSAIFKKEDFLKTTGYDENMKFGYEDWEFWLQLLNKDDFVKRINSVEFYYRKHGNSMISFVKNNENLKTMTDYIFKKHETKYLDATQFNYSISYFSKNIENKNMLNEIKSSFTYKTFYKVEKEMQRFFKRFKH